MLGHGCATRSCVCAEQANKPFFIRQMNMCADKYVCECVCVLKIAFDRDKKIRWICI